jgi:hypothetical protein
MVASSANSPTSNPPFVRASKIKAIAYKQLEHRNKAVASPTHSKGFLECANLFAPCPGFSFVGAKHASPYCSFEKVLKDLGSKVEQDSTNIWLDMVETPAKGEWRR